MNIDEVKHMVFSAIRSLLEVCDVGIISETRLIGDGSVMDSMKLLELCLALEDLASEVGFEFDWTSDVAMSRSRGMFRTAGTLAEEFFTQMEKKK